MAVNKRLRCRLITPDRQVFDVEAGSIVFPAHDGKLGILKNRAPLLCKMGIGICRVTTDQGVKSYYVDSGFARMLDDCLTILTEDARAEDEIDPAAAQRQLTDARARSARNPQAQQERSRAIARASAQLKLTAGASK